MSATIIPISILSSPGNIFRVLCSAILREKEWKIVPTILRRASNKIKTIREGGRYLTIKVKNLIEEYKVKLEKDGLILALNSDLTYDLPNTLRGDPPLIRKLKQESESMIIDVNIRPISYQPAIVGIRNNKLAIVDFEGRVYREVELPNLVNVEFTGNEGLAIIKTSNGGTVKKIDLEGRLNNLEYTCFKKIFPEANLASVRVIEDGVNNAKYFLSVYKRDKSGPAYLGVEILANKDGLWRTIEKVDIPLKYKNAKLIDFGSIDLFSTYIKAGNKVYLVGFDVKVKKDKPKLKVKYIRKINNPKYIKYDQKHQHLVFKKLDILTREDIRKYVLSILHLPVKSVSMGIDPNGNYYVLFSLENIANENRSYLLIFKREEDGFYRLYPIIKQYNLDRAKFVPAVIQGYNRKIGRDIAIETIPTMFGFRERHYISLK